MSVYRIIDFQGHFVDLVNGAQGDDVPIQSYTKAAPGNEFNQQVRKSIVLSRLICRRRH